jgi:hypothetical protein
MAKPCSVQRTAGVSHKFTNLGPEWLDIVCNQAAGVMEQVDLE